MRRGEAVGELLALARQAGAEAIYFNRDPDPHGRKVEAQLREQGRECGVEIRGFKDVCCHERDELLTGSGGPYRVFTPYSRAWLALEKPDSVSALGKIHVPKSLANGCLPELGDWDICGPGDLPEPGERAARRRLKEFLANRLSRYAGSRNTPAGTTTSRLSQDLRFGLLSVREIYSRCVDAVAGAPSGGAASIRAFVSELIWREFYMAILWHWPEVLDVEFSQKFRGMAWPGSDADFKRWCDGETGFPIVDAAMRQLNATGFMHNRTRMIAAMFLTKDLQVDWRRGEQYFMQKLTDGEIASNNGGWQWSAGTGADAAPYFRIQNPWTQTKRYDPDGAYIREWVPELAAVDARQLCEPPKDGRPIVNGYPAPMVDHARARERTLELFASHGK